jgi:hypothetical protein
VKHPPITDQERAHLLAFYVKQAKRDPVGYRRHHPEDIVRTIEADEDLRRRWREHWRERLMPPPRDWNDPERPS